MKILSKSDAIEAVKASSTLELAGFVHVSRNHSGYVVRSQVQDVSNDVLVWFVAPSTGLVRFVKREEAFSG